MLTLLLGGLSMREPGIASAVAVVVAILLASRNRLHAFVRSVLTEDELHQALIFAAAVVVVLPLMPNRYLGPLSAINPRIIWKFVALLMSVSAAGYVAVRILGVRRGLPLAGLASGFASSAATIATMGARMKEEPALARSATAGAALSSIATIVEMAVVLQATNRSILPIIRFPLVVAGLATVMYGLVFTLRTLKRAEGKPSIPTGSVFDLKTTLVLAATVTGVTLVSALVNSMLGRAGVTVTTALAGFGDAHSAAVAGRIACGIRQNGCGRHSNSYLCRADDKHDHESCSRIYGGWARLCCARRPGPDRDDRGSVDCVSGMSRVGLAPQPVT